MFSFKPKKKRNKSLLYRISAWLHLWLGLLSGVVVFIVSVTGAIYTFKEEIQALVQPYQTVTVPENGTMLPPSQLSAAVVDAYDFPSVWGVGYRGEGKSAVVPYYSDPANYQEAYVNPYTGEPLHNQRLDESFFRFIISGHYQLWMPRWLGKPIVAYGTLLFVILLISGMVLWWPKKWRWRYMKSSFTLNWSNWRRINLDLHNVVGFYFVVITLILGLTGMVYGMQWFRTTVYWTASGGEMPPPRRAQVASDTTLVSRAGQPDQDILYANLMESGFEHSTGHVWFYYPRGKEGTWNVEVNPNLHNSFRKRSTYYEQHSLKQLKKEPAFAEANGGEQLARLNYDLHVGAIGGIWTKIIAFLACIVSASLPVTGFIFWWDRERRQSKLAKKRQRNASKKKREKARQPAEV